MMYRIRFILIGMMLFAGQVMGQGVYSDVNIQEWPAGSVFLTNGDSVQGAIKYYYKEDIINVLKEDGSVCSFTPVNVHYFVTKNFETGSQQVFRTFYWDMGDKQSGFKKPTFFEQLNHGELTLIKRETYTAQLTNGVDEAGLKGPMNSFRTQQGFYSDGVQATFYILLSDGEIRSLKKTRKELLQICGDKADEVKRYAKKHRLSYDQTHGLLTLVNYYNSL